MKSKPTTTYNVVSGWLDQRVKEKLLKDELTKYTEWIEEHVELAPRKGLLHIYFTNGGGEPVRMTTKQIINKYLKDKNL